MPDPQIHNVISALWRSADEKDQSYVYAILDAARNEKIYSALLDWKGEFSCLYRGQMAETLAHVAPYLVKLDQDSDFTKYIIRSGWGDSWGIFVQTTAGLRELRKHFRQFLTVYNENAESLYFRYYDPRVLRVFFPTCDAQQLFLLFGPVQRFCLEGEDINVLDEYTFLNRKLVHDTVQLDR
jgi:hypothetical protein